MTKRALISGVLAAIGILCLSGLIVAQEITGSIVGSVTDSNGAAVPNATVTITLPSQGDRVVRTVTTTSEGNYSAPNLPVAVYKVTVEAPNFKKVVNSSVKVDVGQRRQLDVTLAAGQIDEVVTVNADSVVIEATTPTAGTTISGNQVRELSINNRNFVQLVTLAPGVTSNLSDQVYVGTSNPDGQANTVQISVNGARSSQNTFTVDGRTLQTAVRI
ncbi:MAG: carboxypeptidase-like regulatory domain-containing protein [Acidobacteria bacterium]|nr:carboxypeptidase-like regulatory domain-containing protein [Acidobacteriota bacterium]